MLKPQFRRLRFTYWYLKSYVDRYLWIILVSFLAGLVFFKILFPVIKAHLFAKPLQKIGLIGTFTENSLPPEIQNLLSTGLTTLSASGSALPGVAKNLTIKDEGKLYIFEIKDNIYWQDGKKLTADDINYNFKDVVGKPLDKTHFQFKLKEPFSPFLNFLSQPLFKRRLIGLGNYRVKNIEKNGRFLKNLTLESKANILIYKFFPNEKSALSAFKLGEINVLKGISSPYDLKKWPKVRIEPELKLDTVVVLFFNTHNKYFRDKSFRQALTYAVPDKQIKEVKATSPINPISWAYNENLKTYNFNLEEAERLLEKATEASDSSKLTGKIVVTAVKPYDKYLKPIAESWRKLGLYIEERTENIVPYNFDVLLASQEVFSDPDQYLYWHSTSDRNLTKYTSPRVDKLLEDGRKIIDFEERRQKYLDFQKFLVEDNPATFLYYPTVFNIFQTK